MNDDELNRILSEEGDIVPSSGFASSVMEKVYREAQELPPIPFPWMRALPGVILCGALLTFFLIYLVRLYSFALSGWNPGMELSSTQLFSWLTGVKQAVVHWDAGWALLALAVSFITWKLSMVFSTRNG